MPSPDDLNLIRMLGLFARGLAVFLFGLEQLTGAPKVIAGPRLQAVLGTLTANRFRGVFAGARISQDDRESHATFLVHLTRWGTYA
jgi:phosphate:Na+ symporter